jgi:indole-3-glycerol phosphate synthase
MNIRRQALLSTNSANYPLAIADQSPQNILEKIVWHKQSEVVEMQQAQPLAQILTNLDHAPQVRNFRTGLIESKHQPALIAEVKKASPSKGLIRADFEPVAIAQSYAQSGAACLSVLTDREFFRGGFENLQNIRAAVNLPLLCKEFIIDPYQIYWARYCGADGILLIAAILNDQDLTDFLKLIYELNMTALIEVHTQAELERVLAIASDLDNDRTLIGINNRNLETFEVDLAVTEALMASVSAAIKSKFLWVSESGIYTNQDIKRVARDGVGAVLVGESLLRQPDLAVAVEQLLT